MLLEKQPNAAEPWRAPTGAEHVFSPTADDLVAEAENTPLADGGVQTAKLLTQALTLDPRHHQAQLLSEQLHQMFVPRWHFPMLADKARNRAYAQAIEAKVQTGDIVLDIGCGAGLTAMLAARAGAKHVYAIEQQPMIAAAARRVIADNGLSDRITVICKWSHEIIVGDDIPERADVVISEIVDSNLLGEGALATLRHAMACLAKPNARTVPERGVLRAQLVESTELMAQWRPQFAEGFKLSAFHQFAKIAQVTPNDSASYQLRPLGPSADLFHFDFALPSTDPDKTVTALTCATFGIVHAVVVNFEMQLADGISVGNDLQSDGHWGRTLYMLDEPVPATPEAQVTVTAQHDSTKLSLSVHKTHSAQSTADKIRNWRHKPFGASSTAHAEAPTH